MGQENTFEFYTEREGKIKCPETYIVLNAKPSIGEKWKTPNVIIANINLLTKTKEKHLVALKQNLLTILLTILLRKSNAKNKINQKSQVHDSGKQGTPERMDSHDRAG